MNGERLGKRGEERRGERVPPIGLVHSTPIRTFSSNPNYSPDKFSLSKNTARASDEENVHVYQIAGTVS